MTLFKGGSGTFATLLIGPWLPVVMPFVITVELLALRAG